MTILGPCACQGCGEEVVYLSDGRRLGWLHPNGGFACVERFCRRCDEYWPLDELHWVDLHVQGQRPKCRACHDSYATERAAA